MVQTVPSELVHVPASAAGPDRGVVTQALIKAIKAPAKIMRREYCIFMPFIVSHVSVERQASIAAEIAPYKLECQDR